MARDRDIGASDERSPEPGVGRAVGVFVEILAFGCELAMLALLAVAGWGLSSGGLLSIALAVFYPALAVLVWSVWMAPSSKRRLGDPARLIAQIVLFLAVAGLAAAAHHPVWGVVFALVAIAAFCAARVTSGIPGG